MPSTIDFADLQARAYARPDCHTRVFDTPLQRVHVVVELDGAHDLTPRFAKKLTRGVTLERTEDGVQISRLPGFGGPVTFDSLAAAVGHLSNVIELQEHFAALVDGMRTATGRFALDRVALLRKVVQLLIWCHSDLWPVQAPECVQLGCHAGVDENKAACERGTCRRAEVRQ